MAVTTAAELLEAATAIVDDYAPSAPAIVKKQAVELLRISLGQHPHIEKTEFEDQAVTYSPPIAANLIRRSGASSILAPWRRPRARALEVST